MYTLPAHVADDVSQKNIYKGLTIVEAMRTSRSDTFLSYSFLGQTENSENCDLNVYREVSARLFAEDLAWFQQNKDRNYLCRPYCSGEVLYFENPLVPGQVPASMIMRAAPDTYLKTLIPITAYSIGYTGSDSGCISLLMECCALDYRPCPAVLRKISEQMFEGGAS